MEQIIKIEARMLGNVEISYEGKPFTIERNNTTKVNQLFQMLLYYPNGLTREQVMYNLFHNEEIADPSNSLRALVFRLRKVLPKVGLPEEDYVHVKRGVYRISPNVQVDCDAMRFEELSKKALNSEDIEEQRQLLKDACELYAGDFLSSLSGADWVITIQVKLKRLYDRCVKQLCELCIVEKDFKTVYEVSHKANGFYPYDGWQKYEMQALIELGKSKDALKLYEDTETLMFEELGVSVSPEMTKQLELLGEQVMNNTDMISEVKKKLDTTKEEVEGAFCCTYPIFVESYRYIKRVIKRSGQSAWLMLCTITDGKGFALDNSDRLTKLSDELGDAIRKSARGGDMFAKYSNNQYIILLLDIAQEDCVLVQARINDNLSKESRKRYIKYHVTPVNLLSAGTDQDTVELKNITQGE